VLISINSAKVFQLFTYFPNFSTEPIKEIMGTTSYLLVALIPFVGQVAAA
jgi:hypothetical protein